jgi:hypothetical protein
MNKAETRRRAYILALYDPKLATSVDFVLAQYVAQGEDELDRDKLAACCS